MSLGISQCFVMPQKYLRLCPLLFLSFTEALTFPVGYSRSDISHLAEM